MINFHQYARYSTGGVKTKQVHKFRRSHNRRLKCNTDIQGRIEIAEYALQNLKKDLRNWKIPLETDNIAELVYNILTLW